MTLPVTLRGTNRTVPLPKEMQFLQPHPVDYRAERGEQFRVTSIIEYTHVQWTTKNGVRNYTEAAYTVELIGPVLTKNGAEHATQTARITYGNGIWSKHMDLLPKQVENFLLGETGLNS